MSARSSSSSSASSVEKPRVRRLIAGFAIVLGLPLYAALVVTATELLSDHWAAMMALFAVAGVAWVWPAKWLVRWAQRPPQSSP